MFDMDKEKAKFESRARAIKTLIALIFLSLLISGASLIYTVVKYAEKHGLESVVEEAWNSKGDY